MPRLLFDEQLSETLCDVLADAFPEALHVRTMGYQRAPDDAAGCVWST